MHRTCHVDAPETRAPAATPVLKEHFLQQDASDKAELKSSPAIITQQDKHNIELNVDRVLSMNHPDWAGQFGGLGICPGAHLFFMSAAQTVTGNICEIGMGSGASAVLFLMAGNAQVHTFDLGDPSKLKIAAYLNTQFENRLQPHWGDFHVTIPDSNLRCDLIFVDALHPQDVEWSMTHLAHADTEFLYHNGGAGEIKSADYLAGVYLWEELAQSNTTRNDGRRCVYYFGRMFTASTLAAEIQENFGFVFLQVFNGAFIELVASWICRAQGIPDLLNQTLFVATDATAEQAVRKMGVANVVVIPYSSGDLSYGQLRYFDYLLFRAKVVQILLDDSVNVWLVEADSTWFQNPTPFIRRFRDLDVVAGQDGTLDEDIPEAGFIYLNATQSTRKMWSDLMSQHEAVLRSADTDEIGHSGSEQRMLPGHLKKVKFSYFPRTRFVGGKWYSNVTFREAVNPIVIQNNWIVGNANKIVRAKQWGHWLLQEDGTTCLAHVAIDDFDHYMDAFE